MKYLTAIISLLGLNIITVITLLYFSNKSKEVEKENKLLEVQILKFNKQLMINEVEFVHHTKRSYLTKLQKIYFDTSNIDLPQKVRISLKDFEKKELKKIYMVSSN